MELKKHTELELTMMRHGWTNTDADELAQQMERNKAAVGALWSVLTRAAGSLRDALAHVKKGRA